MNVNATKEQFLNTVGMFTWSFNCTFHIDTELGNFVWSDPDYDGDNRIRPSISLKEWYELEHIPFGRDKGTHTIKEYCGDFVEFDDIEFKTV